MSATVHVGDAVEVLRTLPAESVNCCVTSPPYWGLRDYGVAGQLGLEETPQAYVAAMVAVFEEVRRVLRSDGTCWVNLGDSYASAVKGGGGGCGKSTLTSAGVGKENAVKRQQHEPVKMLHGLKDKDLVGIPWRVAFALQDAGWWLRSDCIWHKPNPMPESVRDRPTKAHEYVFLLTKSERYAYDADAIADDAIHAGESVSLGPKSLGRRAGADWGNAAEDSVTVAARRNARTVWSITTQPFKGSHFATMPEALAERCILAGCPEGGTVLDPFTGSGTTGVVAVRRGRSFVGVELNQTYAAMARKRITDEAPLFVRAREARA